MMEFGSERSSWDLIPNIFFFMNQTIVILFNYFSISFPMESYSYFLNFDSVFSISFLMVIFSILITYTKSDVSVKLVAGEDSIRNQERYEIPVSKLLTISLSTI